MVRIKKSLAVMLACTFFLTGCGAGRTGSSDFGVGPVMSSSYFKSKVKEKAGVQKPKLDIIIPVFDPGLPKNPAKYKEAHIWPELRRAEAARFAYKMKTAIEDTGAFGAVRVMPDKTATGDLYVIGKINESNGEKVDIQLKVYDISGKLWFSKSFDHEVPEDFFNNIRNKGKDPYDPVFKQAANRLVEELAYHPAEELAQLQSLTDLRFGANFSEASFAPYMKIHGGKVSLIGYPDKDDTMLRRVKAIRVRDQLFTDQMQPHYEQFNQKMDASYALWQEQSFNELRAGRKARKEAVGKAIGGVALIGLAVLAAVAGANSDSYSGTAAGTTAAIVAGIAGASFLEESADMNKQARFHRDALDELGQSIDGEMAPRVVKFEKTTKKLTGNAKEQFAQWRAFLKRIYAQEYTPDVQL